MALSIGVDTGGTFTDLVTDDGRVVKVPSTPADPSLAVRDAVREARLGPVQSAVHEAARGASADADVMVAVLAHGTTVATNALLERTGAPVVLLTTEGLEDVIEIGRQDRPHLYDQWARRPEPLVPRDRRIGVGGRLAADGAEIAPVDLAPLASLPADMAVALCLLHADLQPAHERIVAAALRARGADVTCSHELAPEMREYERTVTTVVNAYLRPTCRTYLRKLAPLAADVLVMTSAGGLLGLDDAAEVPVRLLVSGPAGGVLAGASAAAAAGFADAVTFDMGGTSTDVCLVLGGVPAPAPSFEIGGFPVRVPSLDVHTIGAGGGSLAWIDGGGALQVGPRSAGADPGPVCYGRGATAVTVTDADVVLERIDPDATFAGLGRLDVAAASAAFARQGIDPADVVAVVDAAMEQAVRRVTVERGVDPSSLALVAFGGAGPLHACAVAGALEMAAVVVPPRAGACSAAGILTAPRRADRVRTWPRPADHEGLEVALRSLAAELEGPGWAVQTAVDCRYRGQSHELTVPSVAQFHAEHERRNGFSRPDADVEVVALRAFATMAAATSLDDLPPPRRRGGRGPLVIAEPDCSVFVPAGWQAEPGRGGTLVLTRVLG